MKNRIFIKSLLLTLAVTPFLSACTNTVEGAGRDIEGAGEAIQQNNDASADYDY